MSPHDRPIAAAIDIGSNSIKMTVGRPDGGGIQQIAWASEVARLGEGVAESARLDGQRIEVAIEALRRFAAQARALGAERVVAVATEATRAAENGEAFLERVRGETGIDVRVIDGDEEAALTFRGLTASTDLSGQVLIADIGGGSTELIVARDDEMVGAQSLAVGSGRLTDRLVLTDPPERDQLAACEAEAAAVIAAASDSLTLPTGPVVRLILVGGTGEYLARLLPEGRETSLSLIRDVLSDLETQSAAELSAKIAIPEARAKVLPAGAAIVAAIAERVRPVRIEVSHAGVRAGLLLETFQELAGATSIPGSEAAKDRNARAKDEARRSVAKANPETGEPEAGFRDTMAALIAERWAAVWAAIPVALAGEDIEGVHDVRVASRRLRAAMDVAAPVFPRPWYKALHRTAKEITGALGEVRDRDVLLEALRADREAAPLFEHPGIDRLIERVDQERAAARTEMEAYLQHLLDGPVRGEIERRFGAVSRESDPTDRSGLKSE